MSNLIRHNPNSHSTEEFYKEIIDKVINNVKDDFLNEGVAEDVLFELKNVN